MNLTTVVIEIFVILALILFNGFLAMAEMAIVSSRKARLQQRAEEGHPGAKVALDLASEPSSFLAAIQIGITLIGILAGAFGGATIAEEIAKELALVPWLAVYRDAVSLGAVVVTVTFLSLIFGELVPKRIALSNPERVAALLARPVRFVSIIARPGVHLLSKATESVVRILGVKLSTEPPVTEEEVKILIEQGAKAGVFEVEEGSMMKRALVFGDRRVSELMTQRVRIVALDVAASFQENLAKMCAAPHSYFPVYEKTPDHLIGVVSHKRILETMVLQQSFNIDLRACLIDPLFVLESISSLKLLERFKQTGSHLALVIDEYGATAGIVTITDLMEALVGDLPADHGEPFARREDGSFLIDGMLPLYELAEILQLRRPEEGEDGAYQTLGGLVMRQLGKIPHEGDSFEWQGYRFEVMDMDGRRVDKVLVTSMAGQKMPWRN